MKKNIICMTICVLAVILLSSCEHKELCYHHPHTKTLRVEFDWRDAPNANPEGMCVFFYPQDGDGAPVRRFDFAGMTGGEIEIQEGNYRIVAYNNDTESVLFDGMDGFDTHTGYTRDGSIFETIYGSAANYAPRATGTEDERVVISPDMMWGCSAIDVEITAQGVSYVCVSQGGNGSTATTTSEQVITLYPHELTCTYTYEVRNVKNLKYATQMCGSLSGMAPLLYFGSEELGTECVTIPFEATPNLETSQITGEFLTFGHHEQNTQPHLMTFYVWFMDGSKYYYTFDVTDQVHSALDKRHVHIIIDGLDFPLPIENGNGFKPSVDEWQVVEEEIVM